MCLFRFDVSLEKVLRNRRRTGRHMPFMNVIPPGLDFSNLKVDLPEDPVIKEMLQHKPAYGGVTPKAADSSPKSGDTPRKLQRNLGESSERLVRFWALIWHVALLLLLLGRLLCFSCEAHLLDLRPRQIQ